MASSSSHFFIKHAFFHILLTLTISTPYAIGCYTAIFGFGDSLTDTGNSVHLSNSTEPPHYALPPNGETYFHHPTGRSCDGRLIIDFIAQNLGLPLVPPYFGGSNAGGAADFENGVNFAVVGAPALDDSFFEEKGIPNSYINISLRCQLSWFKDLLPSLCFTSSDCSKFLQNSLFILGEFGGNDYTRSFSAGKSLEEVESYVPLVVDAIASATNELIELGVETIMVPGLLPPGCSAAVLTTYRTSDMEAYDPTTGCLTWLNKFAEYHNEHLQIELNRNSRTTSLCFTKGALTACCGAGELPYHFNSSAPCGYPPSFAFDDPFLYVNWDGPHLTEAAYRLITKSLLEGPYTIPHINTSCVSTIVSAEYPNFG
ncbi:hypothetical protein F0562_013867 [Nyssa sinensis]|uniref:Uncharacterized protein n=1 Tax=Nyssa sinensis TaxID=561372 RepID=A0A5J4ZPS6_9ASTE|nr:hypothetical protein F0562_013867 [Nyssa sinensis]